MSVIEDAALEFLMSCFDQPKDVMILGAIYRDVLRYIDV